MPAIVVAEDDEAIRTLLLEALGERDGWVATAVRDGERLLEALDSLRPDLILLDVNMPGLNGIEAYGLLRQRKGMEEVPVLFVTVVTETVRRAHLTGPHEILAKPFNLDDLLARVEALLGS